MTEISHAALVPYSVKQMYYLVNDIQSYSDFIPGCTGSRIVKTNQTQITATIDFLKAGISNTFTTSNMLIDNQNILVNLVDGPFKKFKGNWNFTPLSIDACRIELYLDFEFTNNFLNLAFRYFFKEKASNIVQIFINRAKEVFSVT